MKMKTLWVAALALMTAVCASATEMEYSYSRTDNYQIWGKKIGQDYDVAILLPGAKFEGYKVTSINVPVVVTPNIDSYKVWMSSELKVETVNSKKVIVTDVFSADVEPQDVTGALGYLKYTLPEGYTVPAEGVYVGYSFTVKKIVDDYERYPVLVTTPGEDGGLYLRLSKSIREWKNSAEEVNAVSTISVTLDGQFYENGVSIDPIAPVAAEEGTPTNIGVSIANLGATEVKSVGYEMKIGETVINGTSVLETPIPAAYGRGGNIRVEIPALEIGNYPLTFTITEVNGKPNENVNATVTTTLRVVKYLPVTRTLMEEFTGTWCGWCPRGWVAMEMMTERHPDTFVCISYHDGDQMMMANGYPQIVSGFPSAYLNRIEEVDPYYGTSQSGTLGIEKNWQALQDIPSKVRINVDAHYNSDNTVTANTEVVWIETPADGDYRIEYVLCGDGMQDIAWVQKNYYYQYTAVQAPEGLAPFCQGGEWGRQSVPLLVFNDVALLTSGLRGVVGSIESTEADYTNSHSFTFDLSKSSIVDKAKRLNVVAMILKAGSGYGTVINCNKAQVDGYSSVNTVVANKVVESVKYYDLSGREVRIPEAGMYIRSVRYTDGSVDNCKMVK